MRRAIFLAALLITTGLGAAPAVAGGGGHGGQCYTEVPQMDEGWVAVADNCFSPTVASVDTGSEVRFDIQGSPGSHTVTFPGGPDSGALGPESFAVRFNAPGSYTYVCAFHPGMVGTVEAVGSAMPGAELETLDQNGDVIEGFGSGASEAGEPTQLTGGQPSRQQLLISFDPLAASVILLLFLPLTLGATLRIAGVGGGRERNGRIRPQLPWRREARDTEPKPDRRR
jgi:plastocyanin